MADRMTRRARYEAVFPPWALAGAGAAVSIAFLFERSLPVRAIELALFMAAVRLSGKRISLIATLLVSASIVAANLLVPVGKVLMSLGPLRITETALLEGLGKAVTFEGLLCLSKACILPSLRLPGRFGSIIASAFIYYDRIVEFKGKVRPATLIRDADALMLRVWEEPPAPQGPEIERKYPVLGLVALGACVAAAYAPLAFKPL
jgi:hypothetical protein